MLKVGKIKSVSELLTGSVHQQNKGNSLKPCVNISGSSQHILLLWLKNIFSPEQILEG